LIVGYAAFDFGGESLIAIMWPQFNLPPVNINTLIDASEGWIIQSAQAINHSGTIAGYGVRQGQAGRRAVLLHPINPSDITFDADVDVDDLLVVISGWGACATAMPCPADITGDGNVNVDDLLRTIVDWG
jgi:hypothetical protein